MRIPIIAGNWKMHKTIKEAKEFVNDLKKMQGDTDVEVVLCAPYTQLHALKEAVNGTKIKIGAQNMHFENEGAYTGEISPIMLDEIGVEYCIIGHSERRQYYAETNETVNKKLKVAFQYSMTPILCVGETLEERETNQTEFIIKNQITKGLEGLSDDQVSQLVIAYEPIWAIGTGKTATPDQANETIAYIRKVVNNLYNDRVSEETRIQYGGSVKPNNASEIMNQEDIDGALVGGASLKANDFNEIINF